MRRLVKVLALTGGAVLLAAAAATPAAARVGINLNLGLPGPYYYEPPPPPPPPPAYYYYGPRCWVPGHYNRWGYWVPAHRRC